MPQTEANLDSQYITAMAQGAKNLVYEIGSSFLNMGLLASYLEDQQSPPDVISISYGTNEELFTAAAIEAFNTAVMKLGVQGITVQHVINTDQTVGP